MQERLLPTAVQSVPVRTQTRHEISFPSWGDLLGFEVTFPEPIPNTDVSNPLRIYMDGLPEGSAVLARVRDVS
jgi:hypothetical protein